MTETSLGRRDRPFEPGARVAVLGLGRSGTAAARLVHATEGRVYASDVAAGEEQERAAAELREEGIEAEAGNHDLERIRASDLVVVSPGIDPASEVRRDVREAGVKVIAEVELGYRFLASRIVAITGTNGKTTTTALCGHLLETGGLDAVTAGNIGEPLSSVALLEDQPAWVVVELSSFQLADVVQFHPSIGLLLNLAPDHLDRYRDVDRYYSDKKRLFATATEDSRWVLNQEDPDVLALAAGVTGEHVHFSVGERPERGAWLDSDGTLRLDLPDRSEAWATVEDLRLVGRHNVANALAAGLAAALAGCDGEAIGRGLSTFDALPHRLQPVLRDDRDVLWVNDSKATNVSATRVAIQAFDEPVVLVLGGRGKGEDFERLVPAVKDRVRALVAFGEAAPQIVAALGDEVPETRTETGMTGVASCAASLARRGDVVLFSPACSSYDMFPNYEVRGNAFVRAVQGLSGEDASGEGASGDAGEEGA